MMSQKWGFILHQDVPIIKVTFLTGMSRKSVSPVTGIIYPHFNFTQSSLKRKYFQKSYAQNMSTIVSYCRHVHRYPPSPTIHVWYTPSYNSLYITKHPLKTMVVLIWTALRHFTMVRKN